MVILRYAHQPLAEGCCSFAVVSDQSLHTCSRHGIGPESSIGLIATQYVEDR
jgi:hypothetical protein